MAKRRYTAEFKRAAAHKVIIEGQSVLEVSEQLGVIANLLYRWKAEHLDELDANKPTASGSPKEMAAEIAELRKQLAKSQRMNEILKKTVGYFSKDD